LAGVIGRVCHDGVDNDRVEQIEPQRARLAAEVMRFGGDWQDELDEEQTRCSDPQFGIWIEFHTIFFLCVLRGNFFMVVCCLLNIAPY